MKAFIAAACLILSAPSFALAGQLVTTCTTLDKATVATVEIGFEGSYDDLAGRGEAPADALLTFTKKNGTKIEKVQPLKIRGSAFSSAAAGPFFELSGENLEVAVSAAGSEAPSLITLEGKIHAASCD